MRVLALLVAASFSVAGEFPIGSQVSRHPVTDTGPPSSAPRMPKRSPSSSSRRMPGLECLQRAHGRIYADYSGKDVQFAFVNAN